MNGEVLILQKKRRSDKKSTKNNRPRFVHKKTMLAMKLCTNKKILQEIERLDKTEKHFKESDRFL